MTSRYLSYGVCHFCVICLTAYVKWDIAILAPIRLVSKLLVDVRDELLGASFECGNRERQGIEDPLLRKTTE